MKSPAYISIDVDNISPIITTLNDEMNGKKREIQWKEWIEGDVSRCWLLFMQRLNNVTFDIAVLLFQINDAWHTSNGTD